MPGSGDITTEHTIWCSRCEEWQTWCIRLMSDMIKATKVEGWRKIKGLWVCPDCITQAEKEG